MRRSTRDAAEAPPIVLAAWHRSWLAYSFKRYGGKFSRRLVQLGECLPISGFGTVERTFEHGRLFVCLYRWGKRMWFQAGARAFCLDGNDLQFAYHQHPGTRISEFTITENGRVSFRCSYRHGLPRLFPRAQASDDHVDSEAQHFLAHVAGRAVPAVDSDVWHDAKTSGDAAFAPDVRQNLRAHLHRLTDRLRQGEQDGGEGTAANLFYSWLEDSYNPSSLDFQLAFSPPERERLRRFTDLLQTASWQLGDQLAEVTAGPAAHDWTQVLHDAEQTLRDVPALPATAQP